MHPCFCNETMCHLRRNAFALDYACAQELERAQCTLAAHNKTHSELIKSMKKKVKRPLLCELISRARVSLSLSLSLSVCVCV